MSKRRRIEEHNQWERNETDTDNHSTESKGKSFWQKRELASMLNKFGNLLYQQGDWVAAISVYQEGLEVERTFMDPTHPNIAVTLSNIAQIHKLQGNYRAALRLYHQALEIQKQRQQQHNNIPKTITENISATLSSIALVHYLSLNYTKALTMYQEALLVRRKVCGDADLEVASNLNSIGLVLFKMNLHDLAMQSFQTSLSIRRSLLGAVHRDVAIILFNIATVHLERGNDDVAMDYYRQTLNVERASLGKNHPDFLLTMQQVAYVHQQRGELTEALELFYHIFHTQKAGTMPSRSSNKEDGDENDHRELNHTAIAHTLNLIGNVYLQRGETSQLVATLSESLRHLRLANGDDESLHNALNISGFNFYGLSKLHPECASAA